MFLLLLKSSRHHWLRRALGISSIAISIIITWAIWLSTLKNYTFIQKDPFLFLSKAVVLAGTIGMCWTFILATRVHILELFFVGLDKVYHVHKNIGKLSFVAICLHPILQFMRFIPNWSKAFGLFIPVLFDGTFFGLVSLLIFVLLIACTLWIQLPYHIWKYTHSLFIVVLLCTFLHMYLIDAHVKASPWLSIWMYGFMAIAAFSYLYIRVLYYYIGPRFNYQVTEIKKTRKTWNVILHPQENSLTYKPGQFIYIAFNNPVLGTEVHPFSLSSYPEQNFLRLSIKNLGDYTAQMDNLKEGNTAILWGPYGHFYEKFLFENTDAVFIAGGIGITPFLSMLGHEAHHPSQRKSYIFYCVKEMARADFDEELASFSRMNTNITYIPHCSERQGFLTLPEIKKIIGSFEKKNFFLCGPPPMMDAFIKQLKQEGVKNSAIVCENFNFL